MIKAIQTHYKGYKFRSRTEARWAVFFEKLGYNWEYEEEGYVLKDGTYYLPDFCITTPDSYYFIEVKGSHVYEDDKWNLFMESFREATTDGFPMYTDADAIRSRSQLVSGDPYSFLDIGRSPRLICPRCGAFTLDISEYDHGWIDHHECDMETPCGGGHRIYCDGLFPYRPHKGSIHCIDIEEWMYKVGQVAIAARSARFEHGETP